MSDTGETLLERRRRQRDNAVLDFLDTANLVRRIVEHGSQNADELSRALHLALHQLHQLQIAESLATRAEDLEDIEKYGPSGGR